MLRRLITKKSLQINRLFYRSLSNNVNNNDTNILNKVSSEYLLSSYAGMFVYDVSVVTSNFSEIYSPENVASTNGAILYTFLFAPILIPLEFPKTCIIFWLWRLDAHIMKK